MATASKLLNYDEWLQLPENDEGREECVKGVIQKLHAPRWNHFQVVKKLTRQIERQIDEAKVLVASSEFGLIIQKQPVTQRTPDIAVFIIERMVIRDGHVHSAPELAIEVLSPANTPGRVRDKLADYASIGLPEVWVVEPESRIVRIHRLENSAYQTTQLPHDGVTTPLALPSVKVEFASIWP